MADVVIGYDGSDCSKAALAKALRLARDLEDRAVIVFGFTPPGIWGGEIAEHEEAIVEYGERLLDEALGLTAGTGVESETALIPKKGAEALVEVAVARSARMIVVGSYGETPMQGALIGSTAYKLLHLSPCPVLVVPADG